MKRLFIDIETCPNVGYFWGCGYKINISHEQITEERRIICAAFHWEGKSKQYVEDWGKARTDDKLIETVTDAMSEADECVGHYVDGFDAPWVRTRAMYHGIVVPIWKTVDTKAWSSKYFYLNSNKLDYLAKFLGIGTKIRTNYDLWKQATGGSAKVAKEALDRMVTYCKHDDKLLPPVHDKLSLYCPLHTHAGVLEGNAKWSCARCGSTHVTRKHTLVSKMGIVSHQMQCLDCKKYNNIANAAYKLYEKQKSYSAR